MKITRLDIKNFKGLARLTLETEGKNVLLLGENGSGKTSLVRALECFLDSSHQDVPFERNLYCENTEEAFVDVALSDQSTFRFDASSNSGRGNTVLRDAAKAKRFLEYKQLLKTYFLSDTTDSGGVNVFDLLVSDLLADTINEVSGKTFSQNWTDLKQQIPKKNYPSHVEKLNIPMQEFDKGLVSALQLICTDAAQFLGEFDKDLSFQLEPKPLVYEKKTKTFKDPIVELTVTFKNRPLERHQTVLNEARLSAIAICLYIAAALKATPSDLPLLVLDDVLIGLDSNNRLPLINIFALPELRNHQIFLLTYDPVWFDLVRTRVKEATWKAVQFFADPTGVAVLGDANLLARARWYLDAKDYKAAAVYARSALERILQDYCESKKIKLPFARSLKKLSSEDFFTAVCVSKDSSGKSPIDEDLKIDVERVKSIVLNPLSHAQIVQLCEREVLDAIGVVSGLKAALKI